MGSREEAFSNRKGELGSRESESVSCSVMSDSL